jgi:hypothetical protein
MRGDASVKRQNADERAALATPSGRSHLSNGTLFAVFRGDAQREVRAEI